MPCNVDVSCSDFMDLDLNSVEVDLNSVEVDLNSSTGRFELHHLAGDSEESGGLQLSSAEGVMLETSFSFLSQLSSVSPVRPPEVLMVRNSPIIAAEPSLELVSAAGDIHRLTTVVPRGLNLLD